MSAGAPVQAQPRAVDWVEGFAERGYALLPRVVDAARVAEILAAVVAAQEADAAPGAMRRGGGVFAMRNLLDEVSAVRDLARLPAVRGVVEAVLGPRAFAVRGILFDKTPDANWKVSWHQDLAIAVHERREAAGFGAWSEKAGVVHVQPPAAVLERMVTLRLHLDDCGPGNGPVRVIPGSHLLGRLSPAQVQRLREERESVDTCLPAGGVLLMRPLLLHASSPASLPAHRRVVHLEFAVDALPAGLEWYGQW